MTEEPGESLAGIGPGAGLPGSGEEQSEHEEEAGSIEENRERDVAVSGVMRDVQ